MCAKSRPVPNSLLPATASRLRDYAGGGRRVLTPQQEAALARTRCRMEQGWPIGRMPQRKQSTGSNSSLARQHPMTRWASLSPMLQPDAPPIEMRCCWRPQAKRDALPFLQKIWRMGRSWAASESTTPSLQGEDSPVRRAGCWAYDPHRGALISGCQLP